MGLAVMYECILKILKYRLLYVRTVSDVDLCTDAECSLSVDIYAQYMEMGKKATIFLFYKEP